MKDVLHASVSSSLPHRGPWPIAYKFAQIGLSSMSFENVPRADPQTLSSWHVYVAYRVALRNRLQELKQTARGKFPARQMPGMRREI